MFAWRDQKARQYCGRRASWEDAPSNFVHCILGGERLGYIRIE
jgi:hypothetical protein